MRKKSILTVDDEAVLKPLAKILEHERYKVDTAETGKARSRERTRTSTI